MLTHHGIEDFSFRTQENQLEAINKQIHNARMSGGVIAAISLLVGGIGIMNIMLASINERIREIGICKAVGATGLAIFIQVLIESIVIALLGAALGVAASYGFVRVLEHISPTANAPVITPRPWSSPSPSVPPSASSPACSRPSKPPASTPSKPSATSRPNL